MKKSIFGNLAAIALAVTIADNSSSPCMEKGGWSGDCLTNHSLNARETAECMAKNKRGDGLEIQPGALQVNPEGPVLPGVNEDTKLNEQQAEVTQ